MESVCINNTVQCRVMLTEQEVNLTEQGEMHIELHPRLECVAHFYATNLYRHGFPFDKENLPQR